MRPSSSVYESEGTSEETGTWAAMTCPASLTTTVTFTPNPSQVSPPPTSLNDPDPPRFFTLYKY